MISSRKFFTISLMMLVIFFLFQFLQVVKNITNEYDYNRHVAEAEYDSQDVYNAMKYNTLEADNYVVYVGQTNNQLYSNVYQWCTYTKRKLVSYKSMTDFAGSNNKEPGVLVLQSSEENLNMWAMTLKKLATRGTDIIFSDLPSYEEIEASKDLQSMFGISQVISKQQTLTGVKLFSGFLLGGEGYYVAENANDQRKQDLETEVPWYRLGRKTKTYMVGMIEDKSVINENLPAIMWMHNYENAQIFCVNGSYMYDLMGVGFLQAMANQGENYSIYPVVNAQNLVISNYPGLATENDDKMNELYSRDQSGVFEDIVWPGLTAICKSTHFKMTMMMAPQMNYQDSNEPKDTELKEYLKEMNEEDAEAGISFEYVGNVILEEKLRRDNEFFERTEIKYQFASAVLDEKDLNQLDGLIKDGKLSGIQSLVCDYSERKMLLTYFTNNITIQHATSSGFDFTYSNDLRLKAIQTVLAYNNVHLDMRNILWPKSEEDRWENYFKDVTNNLYSYGTAFDVFDTTTISESDARVRKYMAMNYSASKDDNEYTIHVENVEGDTWFIYRETGKVITKIKGGTFEKIEDGVYLIHAEKNKVSFKTREEKGLYYTLPD